MLKSMSGYGGVVWPADARGQLGIFANTLSSMGLEFGYPGQFNGLANLVGMIVILLFVFTAPNVQQLMNRYPVAINPPAASTLVWAPDLRWGLLIGFMALLSILRLGQMTEFLYFQF
jgi:hypothetical protein